MKFLSICRLSFAPEMPFPYQRLALEMASQAPVLRLRINGSSMAPLLQDGESVIIQAIKTEALCPGDVIAFRRNAEIITHRLVAIRLQEVLTMGDNLYELDPPVSPEMILGHVIALERDEHQISLSRGGWAIIHRVLAWLGWQGAAPHRTGWVARFPRVLSWLVRSLVRISLFG
jgi:hypothetical protein